MNFPSFFELKKVMRNGHRAIASYGGQYWHILKLADVIYYYDPVHKKVNGIVPLSKSDLEAEYEITNF